MSDTRARDALAAALIRAATLDGDTAAAILTHPYTPDQRRALAAAFLDADALAEAMYRAINANRRWEDEAVEAQAAAVLAALRETP